MKQEVMDALKQRRSIRQFQSTPISKQLLDEILEAGIYAPNAAGKQEAVVVAIQQPEIVKQLDTLNGSILNPNASIHPYYGAPVILLIFAPKDGIAPAEDGSLIAGNLMNAAYAAGLGSCWIHRTKEMFETDSGKALMAAWGLAESMMGIASIAIGYPTGELPTPAPRKKNYIIYS